MARARITLLLSVLLLSCMVYPGKSWPLLEHLVGGDFDDFDGSMDNSKGTTKLDKRTWHIGVTPYTPGLPPQHGAGYTWPIFNPACPGDQQKYIRYCYKDPSSLQNIYPAFQQAIGKWGPILKPDTTSLNIAPARACHDSGGVPDLMCMCSTPGIEDDVLVISDGDGTDLVDHSFPGYDPPYRQRTTNNNPMNYMNIGSAHQKSGESNLRLHQTIAHEFGRS
jgi:hypothetical protein